MARALLMRRVWHRRGDTGHPGCQFLAVAVTPGIDWIEIVLQVAVVGVGLIAPAYGRR